MRDRLPAEFLVMNGDVLTDLDYADLLGNHMRGSAPMTVATYCRQVKVDFGVLTSRAGRIVEFTEKPTLNYQVSMGVYGVSRDTLADYPARSATRVRRVGAGPARQAHPAVGVPLRRLLARHRPAGRLRPGQRGVRPAAGTLLKGV